MLCVSHSLSILFFIRSWRFLWKTTKLHWFFLLEISEHSQHSYTDLHKIKIDNGEISKDKATFFLLFFNIDAHLLDKAGLIHYFLKQNTFLFEDLLLCFIHCSLSKSENFHHDRMLLKYNRLHKLIDSCSLSDTFAQ